MCLLCSKLSQFYGVSAIKQDFVCISLADLLVGEWQRTETFADNAVLVTVELDEIEGTTPHFFPLKPSKRYPFKNVIASYSYMQLQVFQGV